MLTPGFVVTGSDRPLALPIDRLEVTIEAPPSVKGGTTLDFVVVLRNPTDEAISFGRAPAIGRTGSKRVTRSSTTS